MIKNLNKIVILSIILSFLIVIPASFATDVADDNILANMDDGHLNEEFLANENLNDKNLTAIDDNNLILGESNSSNEPNIKEYYFDSNVENDDGNGSIDNPYKQLRDDRIESNSILHFASGIYNYTPGDSNKVNVTIIGQDSSSTIINNPMANFTFKVNEVFNIENIAFNNLQIILKNTTLNATNVNFYNATAISTDISGTSCGGAICSLSSEDKVFLNNCGFYNNFALYGGAIFTNGGFLNISNCLFLNNSALYYGGAIYQIYGNLSLISTSFIENRAREGGAVYIFSKNDFLIENNNFTNNSANNSGGAIYTFFNKNYTINLNYYENNSASICSDLFENSNLIFIADNYTLFRYDYGTGEVDVLPSYYNLADYGFVSSIKNQANGGNCWAFGTLASLESAVIRAIYDMNSSGLVYNYSEYADIIDLLNNEEGLINLIDFSDENMKNLAALYSPYGWKMETNNGGYDDMGVGYLASWLGPIYDVDDPYDGSSILSPVLSSITHIQNIVFLKRESYTDNDMIKRAIMEYGAVFSSVGMHTKRNDNIGYYVYNDNNQSCNHAVTLVGWDDDIEIPNAPGKGAWIVKNSWGPTWGNSGYFYLSYYDVSAPKPNVSDACFAFILNDTIKYNKNYQYDIAKTDYLFNATDTAWYKNIFTATDNEYLSAVSTYFDKPSNWELYVYVNDILKSSKSGFSNPGYWTINLYEHVPLNVGDIFEIVFKINVTGDVGVPISEIVSLNNEFYSEGVSFVTFDNINWLDLYDLVWMDYPGHTYNNSKVACIKAFTVFDIINTTTSLDIVYDGTYNPVNITAHVLNQYGLPVNCGKVIFNLSGTILDLNVSNGIASISHIFERGFNTIFAEFSACGYGVSYDNSSVDITKYDVNMTASIDVDFGTALVSINLTEPINETIFIDLGYKNFTTKSIDGKAFINLTGLNLGENNIKITLYNAVYDCNEILDSFVIEAKRTMIVISDLETVYNSGAEYKILLTDQDGNPLADKELQYTFNNVNGTLITNETGEASLTINLTNGIYGLDIRFDGEEYYLNSSNSSIITVKSSINFLNDVYLYKSSYNVHLLDKTSNSLKNQSVMIIINGQTFYALTDDDGIAKLDIELIPGSYEVSVQNPNTLEEESQMINILPINTTTNLNIVYNGFNPVNVTVYVLDQFENPLDCGKVIFNFAGTILELNITDGMAKTSYNFPRGLNEISAEFNAIGYGSSSDNDSINIDKIDVNMTADISVELDTAMVNVNITQAINETVFISLGYRNFTVQSIDGKASINLTDLNPGLNIITISLYDALYECNEVTDSFTIDKMNTYIVLVNLETVYKSGISYKIKLLDENGSPLGGRELSYTLNQVTKTIVTDNNGDVSLNISLATGNYNLNVKYGGEKLYLNSSNSSIITVKTSIVTLHNNYTYGSKYSVKLLNKDSKPLANQNVVIVFAGKKYTVKTDSSGIAKIDVKLSPGTYSVNITNPNTSENRVQKIKVLKRITENKGFSMYYGAGTSYKVRVYDDYGNIAKNVTVKFSIAGKTYSRTTNNNGYAALKINLNPKKYAITATYKGFKVKNNIIVKPTIVTKNISKKKASIIKFDAKLLNTKGKILKSKVIKFKFKGKYYKVKTNNKGIASLKLKNLKVGKYSIVSTYGKLNIKNTITVKK